MLTAMKPHDILAIVLMVVTLLAANAPHPALAASELPPAPADGILDDTRAFTDETQKASLAADMRAAGQALKCDVWLAASTFLTSGENISHLTRDLRHLWSPENDAILLVYDRLTEQQTISFSPGLWQRYPSANLFSQMRLNAEILAQQDRPLADRLSQIMRDTLAQLQRLEAQRPQLEQPLPSDHRQMATYFGGATAAVMFFVFIIGTLIRRRQQAAGA